MSVMTLMPSDTELSVHVEQKEDLAGGLAAVVFDSTARTYRYLLTRIWDPMVPPVVFLMLNPSTADAFEDDSTIRRCTGFAKREGAGGLIVVNLFGLRSTDPRALRHHPDPVGPLNDVFIRQATSGAHTVVAAWGAGGVEHGRGPRVAETLTARRVPLQCLGRTSTGQPRHPLYLPGAAVLEPYGLAS
ncbi:DUF1643 domain-containing protein [Streptomyces sp. NBC_00847]|uniref:DUF1643 domain-containing protein n=1 Tax=Streptomyces sp. NBC_00847 TaxID=2975850 RepID=UPI00225E39C0|nr:DUF1643 domain-containing protein [Streptomyces sp. NBC_00847]MCX4885927.1 DUF1643 domain-containing protein [Streptomyces sp. NBC_00847]